MDPSIMKLLEEDEDESMHSGADVEAFTAALNRDIEGGASTSHPSQSDTSFSLENSQTSSQLFSHWQSSTHGENSTTVSQSLQQDLRIQELQDDQHSKLLDKEHDSSGDTQKEVSASQATTGFHSQYKPMEVDGPGHQVQQKSVSYSQSSASPQMQISVTSQSQIPENERTQSPSSGSRFSKMQRPTGTQPAQVTEQVGAPSPRQKQIPFGCLLPIILPELDKDRAMQLTTLYSKLRKNEIPKDGFVRHMRTIVGDQMLKLAVFKMQAKSQNQPQQQHPRPPTSTGGQFSDTYSFGQQQQNTQSNHPMPVTGASRAPPPGVQPKKDPGHQIVDSNSVKLRDMQHLTDSHGLQANQKSSHSAISMQGHSKQQQEHLHFSQSPFSMYGTTAYHSYAGTNVSSPSMMVQPQPQPHDLQMRQFPHHQGFGPVRGDGSSQAANVISVAKVEKHNSFNDPKSIPGSTLPNMSTASMQHSSAPRQAPPSKEQKPGALPSMTMGYVKQEPTEQAVDKQQRSSIFQSQGPTFTSSVQVEQGRVVPVTSNDDQSQRHNSGMTFPSGIWTTNVAASSSVSSQMETDTQVGLQTTPAGSISVVGGSSKTATKKPVIGQKKSLDVHTLSPPLPSKKQKVSGSYADQSIEHLNDVTAVSGVNLREEEEQLFSAPKDDSRVSDASRKAVQEEEDRLILQKNPLQKKLAEIMTKCGLKGLSSDVERCLSLCVEERLRALISSLIRVSKQRVDPEKSGHSIVVTSDVREQILTINRKARQEWEKKQAEADKLNKQNELPDASAVIDVEREKDEGRAKSLKVNKEEDDKIRTTAANVAARAAVGGDDMLSKWQLMAQARQKRDGGTEIASSSQGGKDANLKHLATSTGNVKEIRGAAKKDQSATPATSGMVRQVSRNQVTMPSPRVTPSISIKDVIAVLEREPQMAKSTIIYKLYDRLHSDVPTD